MSEYLDAIVFIDRHKAKVFHVGATDEVKLVFEHTSARRRHHQANHEDSTKHAVDDEFLHRIAGSVAPIEKPSKRFTLRSIVGSPVFRSAGTLRPRQ